MNCSAPKKQGLMNLTVLALFLSSVFRVDPRTAAICPPSKEEGHDLHAAL
jgi:hypothetical protein